MLLVGGVGYGPVAGFPAQEVRYLSRLAVVAAAAAAAGEVDVDVEVELGSGGQSCNTNAE